ncbi:MAG: hypothetical protein M1538_00390 [Candidatus Marsarchaeota archaeon]|jgi:ribosomal protein L20A (L18A)|nr:hypothetical protein [Candidatus Marsarchaeota archaeon]
MKYVLRGILGKANKRTFEIVVDAKSEKHAAALAVTKLGSKSKIKKYEIEIKEIKKQA